MPVAVKKEEEASGENFSGIGQTDFSIDGSGEGESGYGSGEGSGESSGEGSGWWMVDKSTIEPLVKKINLENLCGTQC